MAQLGLEHALVKLVAIGLVDQATATLQGGDDPAVRHLFPVFALTVLEVVMVIVQVALAVGITAPEGPVTETIDREDPAMVTTVPADLVRVVASSGDPVVTIDLGDQGATVIGLATDLAIGLIGTSGTTGAVIDIPISTTIGTITGTTMAIGTATIGGTAITAVGTTAPTSIGGDGPHGVR